MTSLRMLSVLVAQLFSELLQSALSQVNFKYIFLLECFCCLDKVSGCLYFLL